MAPTDYTGSGAPCPLGKASQPQLAAGESRHIWYHRLLVSFGDRRVFIDVQEALTWNARSVTQTWRR